MDIKFVADDVFRKFSKKERMAMPMFSPSIIPDVEIDKLVLVPTREKSSGYGVGAFFAHTPNKGWWRPMNYDCWRISTDLENPAKIRYGILKGDFEYGGVNIFGFLDDHHRAYMGYGGEITIVPSGSTPPHTN